MTLHQQVVQDFERTLLAKRDENVATVSHPDVYCCTFWSGGFLEELRLQRDDTKSLPGSE